MILYLACTAESPGPAPASPALPHAAGVTVVQWSLHADEDGDGFGAGPSVPRSTGPEPGWVLVAGDCDDTRSDVHPGGIERCDGVDEDCDGEVDDDATDALTWFVDGDGDGFGAEAGLGCTLPVTAVDVSGDCDDVDASAHPGGTEVCGDEVDQDCSGADLRCRPEGVIPDIDAEWRVASNAAWLTIGKKIATGGDVDGDGRVDIAFGTDAQWRGYEPDDEGVWLLPHVPDIPQVIDGTEPKVMYRDDPYWFYGLYLIDDVSGDGRSELAIAWEDPGCLELFTSPPTAEVSADEGDHAICVDGGTAVGDALAQLEDGAIAVSGVNNIYDGGWLEQAGRVWVIEDPWSATDVSTDADAWLTLDELDEDANLGTGLCAGDLNGDGLLDLATGSWDSDGPSWSVGGFLAVTHAPFDGEVQLANRRGQPVDAAGVVRGVQSGDGFAETITCERDLSGDGLADVLVGTFEGRYAATVFFGPGEVVGEAPEHADWTFDSSGEGVGVAANTGASDLDGDGLGDVVLGRQHHDTGLIFWGGDLSGTATVADADVRLQTSEGNAWIYAMAGGSDLDGDGFEDVLYSMPCLTELAWWGGGIGVIYGGALP